ncbi:MAG TPA: hypothetical protein PK819_04800 [Thermomicrobiales bacterium]|nr:hypothetical protein [Thermomicrobiales bacterium]
MRYMANRKTHRLQNYDYGGGGTYFLTICTEHRAHLFGEIIDGAIHVSNLGEIVHAEWETTLLIRREIQCHAFVIMPNHVHALVHVDLDLLPTPWQPNETAPTNLVDHRRPKSISTLVIGFKGAVTRTTRSLNLAHDIWQRDYHDHILRVGEYERIKTYIETNPQNWLSDKFNEM